MPYIDQESRTTLSPGLVRLKSCIRIVRDQRQVKPEASISFIIHNLLNEFTEKRFSSMCMAIGILVCAALEFYRAHLGPYEEHKKHEHGDLEAPQHKVK